MIIIVKSNFAQSSQQLSDTKHPAKLKTIQLFNVKNFNNWYTFIKNWGHDIDPKKVFAVKDGVIRISGEEWGCITTNEEYENYNLVVDYGLEYLKLDYAVVTSAYTYDHNESGCYATNHPGHKDHNKSLFTNYDRLWQLFDELHTAKPNLFIDCTFEAMGGTQLIDYAMLKHTEGDWLSNFSDGAGEKTDIRVRNMA
jgi:hypothetical protein